MTGNANLDLEPIEKVAKRLGADAVFGQAVKEGGITIVPVAEVRFGFGYGFGSGRERIEEDNPDTGEGSGGGSVAGGRASPKGYIRVSPEGVRFEPIPDVTRIALAGVAFAAWMVFWISIALRGKDRKS